MSGGAVYTIPPDCRFLEALVDGLRTEPRFGLDAGDPAALARVRIFLPTRRACRSLAETFVRANGGRPLLLPRITPLGDIDDDDVEPAPEVAETDPDTAAAGGDIPPAIPPLRRQLLLARLVTAGKDDGMAPDQAARLAAELARLLDQVHTEGLSFADLATLVPDDFARHWQITLDFLAVLTRHWPEILAAEGAIDLADRRNRLLRAQAGAWRERPPATAVIAAGSTGSIPATAELLAIIAGLPRGAVVLPGLDTLASDESWKALEPTHPQYAMAQLLARLRVDRAAVMPWPGARGASPPSSSPRARLINLALRPAATAHAAALWPPLERALDGVVRIVAPTPQEEARAIALVLRETLIHPQRHGMLVTPDRALARRVAGELARWDIAVDDSAGAPLERTQPGAFLRLTARMLTDELAPVPFLAALKHPLAAAGLAPAKLRRRVRRLERKVLRGPRPAPGLDGLTAALARSGYDTACEDLLARLRRCLHPLANLVAGESAPFGAILAAHLAVAEALAETDREKPAERLWVGEAGEAAFAFASELIDAAHDFPPVAPSAYPALLDELMAGRPVRPRYGRHPRLAILGPLEARLLFADVVVLAGLNEGTWPPPAQASPWMSRPMMADFGLPPPERRIGLSAHDFAQSFCAPKVYLSRAARVDGAPTVASRWLVRLENVALDTAMKHWLADASLALGWQALLDRPAEIRPVRPPAPRPPVEARPRRLSVTRIEAWMRDPYTIYARHILRLKPLEPLDEDPSAANYGQFVHRALDAFVAATPGDALPADALERLLRIGRQALAETENRPSVLAFWWPRFERIARWFVATERERRGDAFAIACEAEGRLELEGPAGRFLLTGRADRIDRLRGSDELVIIDYKTGAVPSAKEIHAGFAPQLPLEAAIASAGGFSGVPAAPVVALEHWRLHGRIDGGERCPVKSNDVPALANEALDGVLQLIARFDLPETPYASRPRAASAPRFDDYEHLARVREWSAGGDTTTQ